MKTKRDHIEEKLEAIAQGMESEVLVLIRLRRGKYEILSVEAQEDAEKEGCPDSMPTYIQ